VCLEVLQDAETGKIPPRLVDIDGDQAQMVFKHLLNYITPRDYGNAKQYLDNPEDYDFYKILNW
jgi:6-phosphofructokinase 1